MTLDEIVLQDYGVFAGRQTITLTPPSERKPVILFGGLNGGGKTTLLDAIQLCMFGPISQCSNRGTLGYHEFLRRCIHRHADPKKACLELSFRHRLDGEEQGYRLHRSWRINSDGIRERFKVIHNGTHETTLTENWSNQVQDFLPANIAHLFLFNGERIESYANDDHSAQLIGSAIESLLGLDIVDQLNKDLEILERRKCTEKQGKETQVELKSLDDELNLLRLRHDHLKQERSFVSTHKFEQMQTDLSTIEARYRKVGGKFYDQRGTIETRHKEAVYEVETGKALLRELAAGDLPLLFVNDLLIGLAKRDKREEAGRLARDVLNTIEERDATFMGQFRRFSKDEFLLKKIEQLFAKDREYRRDLSKTESYLGLSEKARGRMHLLLDESLNLTLQQSKLLLNKQRQIEEHLEHMQFKLASIPAPDTLTALIQEREQVQKDIASTQVELNTLDAGIARLQREIEKKERTVARLLRTAAESSIADKDRTRILTHAPKVRATLKQFRQSVIRRHVKRIEDLILQSYQQLLQKTSLVAFLTINPDSFEIELDDKDGRRLEPKLFSSGERQLLGVALLWGLAKASGRPLPTAIDSPLGRLDTAHRSYLVERYFPFASHQVLLLSTDEEITGDYLKKLKPWIGRSYRLEFDDETGSTQVLSGYFEERNTVHVH